MTMPELFDAPLIAGLAYREEAISAAEEAALIDHLVATDLCPFRFHGWLGNRKTRTFGWRYDFDDASFAPSEPIPDWLESLRETAASRTTGPPLRPPVPRGSGRSTST